MPTLVPPGPGTAAAVLASHFAHVFVSDAGENNLKAAAASLAPADKFSFRHAPAEACADWLPAAGVDLASVAMAFHYMDAEKTVRAVAATLRPGGTLAAVTYGFRLLFPRHPRAQQLWYEMASGSTTQLIKEGKVFPAAVRGLAKGMSGLDWVGVPEEDWEGVKRVYVNVTPDEERPLCFVEPDEDIWTPPESMVKADEEKVFVQDETWGRLADKEWLKGFLVSCQLGYDDRTWGGEQWKEIESIVDGAEGGKVEVRWPVAMLLATRK
jgi:hypothetical protein